MWFSVALFVLLSRREEFPDRVPDPLSVWDIEWDTQNMPYPNLHPQPSSIEPQRTQKLVSEKCKYLLLLRHYDYVFNCYRSIIKAIANRYEHMIDANVYLTSLKVSPLIASSSWVIYFTKSQLSLFSYLCVSCVHYSNYIICFMLYWPMNHVREQTCFCKTKIECFCSLVNNHYSTGRHTLVQISVSQFCF